MGKESRKYYVYAHIDPQTDKPFYIGKGTGKRDKAQRPDNPAWTKKVQELGGNYKIEILKDKLTEDEAYRFEQRYIKAFGSVRHGDGTLLNVEGVPLYQMKVDLSDFFKRPDIQEAIAEIAEKYESGKLTIKETKIEEIDPKTKKVIGKKFIKPLENLLEQIDNISDTNREKADQKYLGSQGSDIYEVRKAKELLATNEWMEATPLLDEVRISNDAIVDILEQFIFDDISAQNLFDELDLEADSIKDAIELKKHKKQIELRIANKFLSLCEEAMEELKRNRS